MRLLLIIILLFGACGAPAYAQEDECEQVRNFAGAVTAGNTDTLTFPVKIDFAGWGEDANIRRQVSRLSRGDFSGLIRMGGMSGSRGGRLDRITVVYDRGKENIPRGAGAYTDRRRGMIYSSGYNRSGGAFALVHELLHVFGFVHPGSPVMATQMTTLTEGVHTDRLERRTARLLRCFVPDGLVVNLVLSEGR